MITFLLVVHIIIAVGLVFFILMQHSEGGASGFVSGQMGNVMSIRGTANFMTKTTSILATLFFLSSIGLAMYSKTTSKPKSIADSFKIHTEEKKQDAKPQAPVAPIAGQASKTDTSHVDAPKAEEKAPVAAPAVAPVEAPEAQTAPEIAPVAPQATNETPKN